MKRAPVKKPRPADAKPTARLIGYARVSTGDQKLDLQLEALRLAGVHPDNIHTEYISGVAPVRPGLDSAMMDARPGDTLVVWKFDRFGRSIRDIYERLEALSQRGVFFRSITDKFETDSAMGRMYIGILAVFAEFERNLIAERTRAGIERRRAKGKRVGRQPKLSQEEIERGREMALSDRMQLAYCSRDVGMLWVL